MKKINVTNGKGWKYETMRHSNAKKFGVAGGKYADKREKAMSKNIHGINKPISPYNYQDSHQEEVIHSGWEKGNTYRYILEGTGDIFRELSENNDKAYIMEKIGRIKKYIFEVEKGEEKFYTKEDVETMSRDGLSPNQTGIHPEDSYEYAYINNEDKFKLMKDQWKEQPINNKIQKKAVELNIAMLDKDYNKAKILMKEIEEGK